MELTGCVREASLAQVYNDGLFFGHPLYYTGPALPQQVPATVADC